MFKAPSWPFCEGDRHERGPVPLAEQHGAALKGEPAAGRAAIALPVPAHWPECTLSGPCRAPVNQQKAESVLQVSPSSQVCVLSRADPHGWG